MCDSSQAQIGNYLIVGCNQDVGDIPEYFTTYYSVYDATEPTDLIWLTSQYIGSAHGQAGWSEIMCTDGRTVLFDTQLWHNEFYCSRPDGRAVLLAELSADGQVMVKGNAPPDLHVDVIDGKMAYGVSDGIGVIAMRLTQEPARHSMYETDIENSYQVHWDTAASGCDYARRANFSPYIPYDGDYIVWVRGKSPEPSGRAYWSSVVTGHDMHDDFVRYCPTDREPQVWYWERHFRLCGVSYCDVGLSGTHPGAAIDCVVITDDPYYTPSDADIQPCTSGWPTCLPLVAK